MNLTVCSVSSYKAKCKESIERWIMEDGSALPCSQKGSCDDHVREGSQIVSCPQFVPDGLLLNLQVHGNRNSMMQNITYIPIDQSPLFSFLLFFLPDPTFTTNYWCFIS